MKKVTTKAKGKSRKKAKDFKVVNVNCAGIDIGSREHYVAVPSDRDSQPVRSFGCLTPDLHSMARWLRSCDITSIAIESTGVYWIPVVEILEDHGLEVYLINARHVKGVPGRKSDVQDCQWIQQLHSYGLLSGSFRPPPEIQPLRSYWRQRACLVELCSQQIQRMQKSLEQMNLQLHKVLSDITGKTGMAIIRSLLKGERDPKVLVQLKHALVKSSDEVLIKALTGNYREEHVFALKQAVELHDTFQIKIAECDSQVETVMAALESKVDVPKRTTQPKLLTRKRRKNQPNFDLRNHLYQTTGVDLAQIDGIDAMTAQTVISECGFDMKPFRTEKHFASWLGLCPNNKITGGKVYSSRTRKVFNRAASALRIAAQSLHGSSTALGAWYRRMRAKLGAPKAITATAHKLAKLIYRMLKFGEDYVDKGQEYYEKQYQERVFNNFKNKAKQLGYQLLNQTTGEVVS